MLGLVDGRAWGVRPSGAMQQGEAELNKFTTLRDKTQRVCECYGIKKVSFSE